MQKEKSECDFELSLRNVVHPSTQSVEKTEMQRLLYKLTPRVTEECSHKQPFKIYNNKVKLR